MTLHNSSQERLCEIKAAEPVTLWLALVDPSLKEIHSCNEIVDVAA